MGKITRVVIDGVDVSEGGRVSLSWSQKHYLTIYYDCEAWFTDCTCKFVVIVDGTKIAEASDVKVATEGGGHPVTITLPEISPSSHTITIISYEGAPTYNDLTDSFSFYAEIKVNQGQTEPTPEPELPYQFPEIPWWVWLSGGIVAVALLARSFTPRAKDMTEKLQRLMELKLMKEIAEKEER